MTDSPHPLTGQPKPRSGQPGPRRATLRLPGALAARAREVLAGRVPPVIPADAATVMLLRPGVADRAAPPLRHADPGVPADRGVPADPGVEAAPVTGGGLEVFMLRRVPSMAFAPGAFVFPGGSVDAGDSEAGLGWAGPDATEWGLMLGAPDALARALVCAAVRETFEESGVLLAGPGPDSVVADTTGGDWEEDRRALLARSVSLAELLRRRHLVLRSDLLRPWSRWITPVTEVRRYDTRFFAAALPAGQRARDTRGESDAAAWVAPGDALAAARSNRAVLLPPTAVTLAELLGYPDPAGALAARRRLHPLIPEVSLADGAAWLTMPDGAEYPL